MYYVFAVIFGILMFLFIGLWQGEKSKCERLKREKEEQLKREQERIENIKSVHEYDITERDIQILRVITKKNRQYCIKILRQIKENGKYHDFIQADSIKQMQDILKETTA